VAEALVKNCSDSAAAGRPACSSEVAAAVLARPRLPVRRHNFALPRSLVFCTVLATQPLNLGFLLD